MKHKQNIDCGVGYVKLFDCSLDQAGMHGDSPYHIKFGPDICGPGNKKVYIIFTYKEKNHLIKKDIRGKDDVFTHLYTLIVNTDGTYEVLIDNESAMKGSLTDDWNMLPPKMIKDPEKCKPSDWVDAAKIDDPEDTKPEDWEKPEHIADPDATKTEDWDDEMDGEWEPPMIENTEYKGRWKARQIDNPDYKGPWVHPEIENPEYNEEEAKTIGKFVEVCKLGFDLWQVKYETIFDDLMITDDPEAAKKAGENLRAVTKDAEKKMKDEQDEEERKKTEAKADTDCVMEMMSIASLAKHSADNDNIAGTCVDKNILGDLNSLRVDKDGLRDLDIPSVNKDGLGDPESPSVDCGLLASPSVDKASLGSETESDVEEKTDRIYIYHVNLKHQMEDIRKSIKETQVDFTF